MLGAINFLKLVLFNNSMASKRLTNNSLQAKRKSVMPAPDQVEGSVGQPMVAGERRHENLDSRFRGKDGRGKSTSSRHD